MEQKANKWDGEFKTYLKSKKALGGQKHSRSSHLDRLFFEIWFQVGEEEE